MALRPRFHPVVIFAGALVLTVKIGGIWEGFGMIGVSGAKAQAQAQQPAPTGPAPVPAPAPAAQPDAPPAADPSTAAGDDMTRRLVTEDPALMSQSEIDLLQQLSTRREELDQREKELDTRVGMLAAAEARIDNKVEELKKLQTTIEGLIRKHSEQEDLKLRSMVKIYENMKPKDAAQIFDSLELDVLLMVAERMSERKLAPIMAVMNPDRAREMTIELTRQRQMPLPGTNPSG
jgi:flagellar motility protein MotE (MotC chaperone)